MSSAEWRTASAVVHPGDRRRLSWLGRAGEAARFPRLRRRLGARGGVATKVGDPFDRDQLHDVGIDGGHLRSSWLITGRSMRGGGHRPITTGHQSLTKPQKAGGTGPPGRSALHEIRRSGAWWWRPGDAGRNARDPLACPRVHLGPRALRRSERGRRRLIHRRSAIYERSRSRLARPGARDLWFDNDGTNASCSVTGGGVTLLGWRKDGRGRRVHT